MPQSESLSHASRDLANRMQAGGHTTGSVIVFVTLPSGRRYAFIGDVAWQLEGVRQLAEQPLPMRKLADTDAGQVRADLPQVAALADLMQVGRAHDVSAYDGFWGWPLRQPRRPSSPSVTRPNGVARPHDRRQKTGRRGRQLRSWT